VIVDRTDQLRVNEGVRLEAQDAWVIRLSEDCPKRWPVHVRISADVEDYVLGVTALDEPLDGNGVTVKEWGTNVQLRDGCGDPFNQLIDE